MMGKRRWLALIGVAGLALVGAACAAGADGGGGDAVAEGLTRTADGGGVEVEATWVTAEQLRADGELATAAGEYDVASYVIVQLAFTTHSGDLNQYDVRAQSALMADGGSPQAALDWRPLSDDPHHREGLLIFARPQGAGAVEVVLRDLADVPQRSFRWAPAPQG